MTRLRTAPRGARKHISSANTPSNESAPATFRRSPESSETATNSIQTSNVGARFPWREWPSGIRHTAIRQRWFEKLHPLPGGLDLAEAAARLNETYHAVYRWAHFFHYPFPDRRCSKPSRVDWTKADWTRRDAEIARELGVSRERVRQVRKKLGIGAPVTPVRRFAAFVAENPQRVASMTIGQAVRTAGAGLGVQAARRILRDAGIKAIRKRAIPPLDWRIPNRDLAAIWGINSHLVATLRRRLGVGPAKWNLRGGAVIQSFSYKKLLDQERLTARRIARARADGDDQPGNQISKYMQNS